MKVSIWNVERVPSPHVCTHRCSDAAKLLDRCREVVRLCCSCNQPSAIKHLEICGD